jgi:hypothetical protein
MFCDFRGNLGDMIRISKMHSFLKKRCKVELVNLRDYHGSWLGMAGHTDVLGHYISRKIGGDPLAKYSAYEKLGSKVLQQKIGEFKPDIIWAEGVLQGNIAVDNAPEGVDTVVDVHGLASAEYAENPGTPLSDAYLNYLYDAENHVFHSSTWLLVVSTHMKDYVLGLNKIGREGKIKIIPNGSDVQQKTASFVSPMRVVYGGIFAFWEDLDTFIDMAIEDEKRLYYLLGDGPLKNHILERMKKEGSGIYYLGYRDRNKTMQTFANMSVGIAPTTKNTTRHVACPIKVFDYMACGLPVVTVDFGEWGKIINQNECGIATKNSDSREFLAALRQMDDRKVWEEFSANALYLIKNKYNWETLLKPIEKIVK